MKGHCSGLLSGRELASVTTDKFIPDRSAKNALVKLTLLDMHEAIPIEQEKWSKALYKDVANNVNVLSHAVWMENERRAEVTSPKGKYYKTMGTQSGGSIMLEPEEAFYLVEMDQLHLMHNDVPLTVARARHLLRLAFTWTDDEYAVYAYLLRAGFQVVRHRNSVVLKKEVRAKKRKSNVTDEEVSVKTVKLSAIKASSWKELKETMNSSPSTECSKVDTTRTGMEYPLCKPEDAVNPGQILKRIHVIQEATVPAPLHTHMEITFDLYLPDKNYRKSDPSNPDFHIVICRSDIPVPSAADFAALDRYTANVPLLFAVLIGGKVKFSSFFNISDMPNL